MSRWLKNIILIISFAIAGIWILKKLKLLPSPRDIFSSKPVVIDKTPILIKEIRSVAQLITITAYDEVVVDSTIVTTASSVIKSLNSVMLLPVITAPDTRIVLIGRGKVLAGTDLKNLTKERFTIKNDTLTLRLPKAVIIDAILNPADFTIFDEKGTWSDEAVRAVKLKARQKMIERALEKNILHKADAKAATVIEDFIRSAGYKAVIVTTN